MVEDGGDGGPVFVVAVAADMVRRCDIGIPNAVFPLKEGSIQGRSG